MVSTIQPAKVKGLGFQVFLDAFLCPFPSETRGLHATKRRLGMAEQAGVQPDQPSLQRLSDAESPGHVLSVEVGSQPERRAVGDGQRLFFGFEAEVVYFKVGQFKVG